MENKKLLNILIKDMQELEELIAEIKLNEKFNAFEFEFIHNRAKGLLSLMNLLQNQEEIVPTIKEKEKTLPIESSTVNIVAPVEEKKPVKEVISQQEEIEPEVKEEEIVEEKIVDEDKFEEDIIEKEPTVEPVEEIIEENKQIPIEDLETEHAATIGDSFASEKSLNDIISESKQNIGSTVSSRPISSLQSAVGINDRFLFIRELFEGDGDQYSNAVKNLDEMNSIQDAVTYLRDNYKWKKNETSLKFIELVKRRFAND